MALAQTPAQPTEPQQTGRAREFRARGGFMRQRLARGLNLTDAQKEQAKAIFQQARESAKPTAEQLKQNHQAMQAAIKANNVSQIQSLATQQGTLRGQLIANRSEALAKFYAILTPEPKTKSEEMQQRVRERLQQRRNRKNG
jgi:Spy/CpxP family protein refolding chaperone